MQFQFDVGSCPQPVAAPSEQVGSHHLADLLRQLLDVQREHLNHSRAVAAAHDPALRWRALVSRWRKEFPELPEACRQALPALERAYATVIAQLVEELRQNGPDALDNDFSMQDFLDRYGMRLGQLGNILNLVGPLAEVGPSESA
jgi:hypothetical protein